MSTLIKVIFSIWALLSACYSLDAMAIIKCGPEIGQPQGTLSIGFSPSSLVTLKTSGVYDVRAVPAHGVVGNLVYNAESTCISDTDSAVYYVPVVDNGACMGIGIPEFEYEPGFCHGVINHVVTDSRYVSSQVIDAKGGVPFHISARVELPISLKVRHVNGSFTLDLSDAKNKIRHGVSNAPSSPNKDMFLMGKAVSYNGPTIIKFITVPPTCVFEINDVDFHNQGRNEVLNNMVSPLHTTLSANCFNALTGIQLKFTSPNGYMKAAGVIKSNFEDLGFLLKWADNSIATKGVPLEFMKPYEVSDSKFTGGNTTTISVPIDVTPYFDSVAGSEPSGQARASITTEINYW